jgi:hypothetical protein
VKLVLTVGKHAIGQAMHAARNLAVERALEFAGAGLRLEGRDLGQERRDRLRDG